ncbi:hypothetical protein TYRP_022833 [Tyrophagus putrescentiae]|nr:hypothetical protein TYRP_022833 [Tyrophagus putrescentiae]
MSKTNQIALYQSEHFLAGFIFEPSGHLKASAKAGVFPRTVLTRKRPGEWTLKPMEAFASAGVTFSHQTWAWAAKKSWSAFSARLGSTGEGFPVAFWCSR